MLHKILITAALLAAPATAQEYIYPQIPTEQQKIAALKLAYRLNGNSMVGNNLMIDLTDPAVLAKGNKLAVAPAVLPPVDADPNGGVWPKPVKKAEIESNVCTRHNMRKSIRGKSWRCVR